MAPSVCQPAVHAASRGRSRERLQVADCGSVQAGGQGRCSSPILPFLKEGPVAQGGHEDKQLFVYQYSCTGLSGIRNTITNFLIPQPDHQRLNIPSGSALEQQEMASSELETDHLQMCSLPQPCRELRALRAKAASRREPSCAF